MATVHHPHHAALSHRNLWTALIVLAIIVAVSIVYIVASAVSQDSPSDVILPAEQPVTGGLATDGGIVDPAPTAETTPAPVQTPLTGQAVTDGAGTGTVTDPTTGQTENGITNGARPTDG